MLISCAETGASVGKDSHALKEGGKPTYAKKFVGETKFGLMTTSYPAISVSFTSSGTENPSFTMILFIATTVAAG